MYSFIAWKFMNNNAKAKFHDVDKIEKKLVTLKLHLQLNEIQIYKYIYINMYFVELTMQFVSH